MRCCLSVETRRLFVFAVVRIYSINTRPIDQNAFNCFLFLTLHRSVNVSRSAAFCIRSTGAQLTEMSWGYTWMPVAGHVRKDQNEGVKGGRRVKSPLCIEYMWQNVRSSVTKRSILCPCTAIKRFNFTSFLPIFTVHMSKCDVIYSESDRDQHMKSICRRYAETSFVCVCVCVWMRAHVRTQTIQSILRIEK